MKQPKIVAAFLFLLVVTITGCVPKARYVDWPQQRARLVNQEPAVASPVCEGGVTLKIKTYITASGQVSDAKPASGSWWGKQKQEVKRVADIAVTAVRTSVFKPMLISGRATPVTTVVSVPCQAIQSR